MRKLVMINEDDQIVDHFEPFYLSDDDDLDDAVSEYGNTLNLDCFEIDKNQAIWHRVEPFVEFMEDDDDDDSATWIPMFTVTKTCYSPLKIKLIEE